MILHPRRCIDPLDPAQCEAVYAAALRILDETGIAVLSGDSRDLLEGAGARVRDDRALLSPHIVERAVSQAPRRFVVHARNPERSVELGADALLVSPGYGSPSVADVQGKRREATLADFDAFAALAGRSDCIDVTGGLLVEPLDVPAALRPLEITRSLLLHSDKPFLGSVDGAEGARTSIETAQCVFGDISQRTVMIGLVNVNSPLRLDTRMAAALLEYARGGQAVLLTPGILMGVTAPVTAAGAAAQALAELLACVTLVQAARPGAPVIIGTGGFGSDLRTGGPGFGRPENALGTLLGAQLARRVGLPFRCSGAVTGSRLPDCRSGYERMMTAMAAWSAGVHLCLPGAGTLDCINSMSFEQFVIDTEIWTYLKRVASRTDVGDESLAVDLIGTVPQDYLGSDHTLQHMAAEIAPVMLATPKPYDEWRADGAQDVVSLAARRFADTDDARGPSPMDDAQRSALDAWVKEQRKMQGVAGR
jgi:trimethylamine---corrinoid protein Co-methyltransferase